MTISLVNKLFLEHVLLNGSNYSYVSLTTDIEIDEDILNFLLLLKDAVYRVTIDNLKYNHYDVRATFNFEELKISYHFSSDYYCRASVEKELVDLTKTIFRDFEITRDFEWRLGK